MAIDLSCFDNIVGLTKTDCDCFADNRPADYNTSTSGKYIDEHINLNAVQGDCSEGNRWDILENAREEAILNFFNDVTVGLRQNQVLNIKPYTGYIGNNSLSGTDFISGLDTYAGVRLVQRNIKGGNFTLKSLALWTDTTGNTDVYVYQQIGEEYTLKGTYTVPTVANKVSEYQLPTPLEIEMYSDECEYTSIYIIYATAGLQIRKNNIHCGCGGVKNTVCSPPCFGWDLHQQRRWTEFTMVTGVTGSDLTAMEDWADHSQLANGLRIKVFYDCRILDGLCKIAQDENHPLFLDFATSINYSSAYRAWTKMLNSGNLSRYTLLGDNEAVGERNFSQTSYLETLDRITKELTPDMLCADCYSCKSRARRKKLYK